MSVKVKSGGGATHVTVRRSPEWTEGAAVRLKNAAFSPESLPGLIAWYDAADTELLGGTVVQVPNRAGRLGPSAPAYGGGPPLFSSTAFPVATPTQPGLVWDPRWTTWNLTQTDPTPTTDWTSVMVIDDQVYNSPGAFQFGFRSPHPIDYWAAFHPNPTGNSGIRVSGWADFNDFGTYISGPQVWQMTKAGNTITVYRDGVEMGSHTDSIFGGCNLSTSVWGNHASPGGTGWRGVMRAGMLFTDALTTTPAQMSAGLHSYYSF